jgi:ABC-type transport system involved in multi-copper enzyme maturation permease subunit
VSYRSPLPPGRDGFAQLVHAEWTKFRTVRGWVAGLVLAALVMVALGLFAAGNSAVACRIGPGSPVKTGRACLPPVPTGPGGELVTDSFYFVHRPLAGDGVLTARMTSFTGRYGTGAQQSPQGQPLLPQHGLEPWSKAGIIVKASTRPGSAYAAMLVTGAHGVRMQYDYTGDIGAGGTGAVTAASPRWLRLARAGNAVTGYYSADGSHWRRAGTVTLPALPATVQVGMFAASPPHVVQTTSFGGGENGSIGPSEATAVFDHLSLPGARPGAAWAGTTVGGRNAAAPGRFVRPGSTVTVTGSGDIAPVVPGDANTIGPTATIEQHLVGAFAGLIVVAVVAAMFITAEYRRGLIRTTLAASPRRGRVLAAKAVVIWLVTFAAGLAAAVIAVTVGKQLASRQPVHLMPVTWLTEVRVVAGTAALLAVAAVLALAVGTMLRRSAAAITVVIVAIVLPYILGVAAVLPAAAGDWLLRLTPAAAFAIQQSIPRYAQVAGVYTPSNGFFPLAPWAGFAVLCGYTALALGGAAWLLRHRDA